MVKPFGSNGTSNRILSELANELSTPLASLFNKSVHQGDVPVCFKSLRKTCILTSVRDNNIFTSFQSGVIPLDSITNQPTFLYNTFCQALDAGKEIRTVFCDMIKAFDRVWHAGLLHKLRYLDDLLNIDNFYFDHMVDRIYPTELQLN